jgi:hypothetical protein
MPTRDATREVFFSAWRTYRAGQPLEGVQKLVVQVALQHPEYHAMLDNAQDYADQDYTPEMGQTNPFLHMGMHIAIEEQLALDQPRGLRARYVSLCARRGDAHAAQHQIMECLGEMLWQAQRDGTQPDEQGYLNCLDKIARN